MQQLLEKLVGMSNVPTSKDGNFCLRYQESQSIQKEEEKGRKKCTTAVEDRKIKQICLRDCSLVMAPNDIHLRDTGVFVSARAVQRRLTGVGLKGGIHEKSHY